MWYTHYYYHNREAFGDLDDRGYPKSEKFWKKREEFQTVVYDVIEKSKERWIEIGNGFGEHYPVIYSHEILFTGSVKQPINNRCHVPDDIKNKTAEFWQELAEQFWWWVVTMGKWLQRPSDNIPDKEDSGKETGEWFAWSLHDKPTISVDLEDMKKWYVKADYDAFMLKSNVERNEWAKDDKRIFNCTKTNFLPFDVTVTAVLIALQVIFWPEYIRVSSDWSKKDFMLGYRLLKESTDWKEYNYNRKDFYLQWEKREKVSKQLNDKHPWGTLRWLDNPVCNESIETKDWSMKYKYDKDNNEIIISRADPVYKILSD